VPQQNTEVLKQDLGFSAWGKAPKEMENKNGRSLDYFMANSLAPEVSSHLGSASGSFLFFRKDIRSLLLSSGE
jgi:hypothetical protein